VFLGSRERATDLALMAHEVTHVVQQQGRAVIQMSGGVALSDRFEREAQHSARYGSEPAARACKEYGPSMRPRNGSRTRHGAC
jgi:hypothetical protein